ncbi:uncharacterized protein LOC143288056 [Babylonia areolata]|uniref:uncharacterized protein LOC143288056 n=1 Tax=Babylonia areolata TaxID=304850 RepID=UPI003FD49519
MVSDVRTLPALASLLTTTTCLMLMMLPPSLLAPTSAFVYRGCAFRPVAGKEQAVWFCLADNLCAMLHCRDNDVFSPHDCGCVPPTTLPPPTPPPHSHQHTPPPPLPSDSGDGGGVSSGGGGVSTTTADVGGYSSSSTSSSVITSSIILSACMSTTTATTTTTTTAAAITTSTASTTTTSSTAAPRETCPAEIQINGLSAQSSSSSSSTGENDPGSIHIDPRGVVDLGNGSVMYDGYSSLSLPSYSNARFHNGLSVHFVVEEGPSRLRQVLLTNCKQGAGPSVEIVLDVYLGVVVFHVMYRFRHALNDVESALTVAVPYQASVPKHVSLVFDGRFLTGRVNEVQQSVRVQGNGDYILAQRRKPFVFGNTMCDIDDVHSYRGQLRQISMYRCAKPMRELNS